MDSTILKNTCLSFGWISSILLIVCLGFGGCETDDVDIIGIVPAISVIATSSDTITEFEETLTITIEYEDGDGDLGYDETDRFALFIRDIRLEEYDGFYMGPIAPPGFNIPVKGQINAQFPDLFIFGNGESEQTRFEIKMVDRMMNQSNIVTTGDILIVK